MNIVDIIQKVVKNIESKGTCDLCFKFVLGGRQDYLNLANNSYEDCECVTIGVLKNAAVNGYVKQGEFVSKTYVDWNVQLFAGIPSRLDLQFYNEVDSNDTCNSKWSKYIYPIKCCFENLDTTICDTHNCEGCETTIEVYNWSMEQKLNFLDLNYDGWIINATFREWILT